MNKCDECGSYAINHHCHGRDGSDKDLCDVCYWRSRSDALLTALEDLVHMVADAWQPDPDEVYATIAAAREVIARCKQ